MPKYSLIKNNFSSGELSPILSTRTDVAQYSNGARKLLNVIPLIEGGVKKRPGTYFRSIMDGAKRLLPFVSTSKDAYLIILKEKMLLVYDPRTNTVIKTLITPYLAAATLELHYVHTRYVMYFTHQSYPVHLLECSEDFSNWEFRAMSFDIPPIDEVTTTPNVALTPSDKELGMTISLIAAEYPTWSNTVTYFQNDRVIYANKTWRAVTDNTNSAPTVNNADWDEVTGSEANVFTSAHLGAIVEINGGHVRITQIVDPGKVMGEVVVELTAVVQAIAKSWVLKTAAFNATLGYPKCCTYFKQRLVFANTRKFPNKIWFSRIGNTTNFLETTDDADAFSVVSSSDQSDSITFLVPQKGLVALTSGAEFLIGSEGVLSPTTVQIDENTAYGAYPLTRPCRVGNEILFVQRGGERLRALSYRYEVDGLVSPEVSAVAGHIGEMHKGISEATYQQEPESLVWLVLGDGKVASITFNREQEVIAWAQHDFGGTALSMCSIPTELGSDYCYMLINRKGKVVLEELSFNAYTDCQRTITMTGDTFDNLQYNFLENLAVYQSSNTFQFYIDYKKNGDQYTLNNITDKTQKTYYVGQGFTSEVDLFPPELTQVPQSSLSNKAKIQCVWLFFYKTQAPKLNGEILELYTFPESPINSQKPFTGRHLYEGGDWSDLYDVKLTITHDKPLPFHLQAIAIDISINER
ncbi:carbohydrate-binding protein [Acinetobacter sp. CFCC 10889]|uniref:phage nozzle protein n=1 Tax=Acinetobacter sp. CFCC 10889 TaxID=1775557 RepID=UPI000DCFFBD7|nr:carbohydrate-binding protein [Acinetobacter sp. CFCC 10889]